MAERRNMTDLEHHMPLSIHGGGVKIPFRQHVYVYTIDQVVAELAIPLIRAPIHELQDGFQCSPVMAGFQVFKPKDAQNIVVEILHNYILLQILCFCYQFRPITIMFISDTRLFLIFVHALRLAPLRLAPLNLLSNNNLI